VQPSSLPDFQLESRLHRAAAPASAVEGTGSLDERLAAYERELILGILAQNQQNLARTAEQLRLSRHALRYRMSRLDLIPKDDPESGEPHT
jgi:DNA-binding NtrC family response regulator